MYVVGVAYTAIVSVVCFTVAVCCGGPVQHCHGNVLCECECVYVCVGVWVCVGVGGWVCMVMVA